MLHVGIHIISPKQLLCFTSSGAWCGLWITVMRLSYLQAIPCQWKEMNHPLMPALARKCMEQFCWAAVCIVELPTELILSTFECIETTSVCLYMG